MDRDMKLLADRLTAQKYRKIIKFKRKLKAMNRLSATNNFNTQSSSNAGNNQNNIGECECHSEKDSSTECNEYHEESFRTEDGRETAIDLYNTLDEKKNDNSETNSGDHSDSDIDFNNISDKSDGSVDSNNGDVDIEVRQHQNQNDISAELRSWAIGCRVPHSTLDSLLSILNPVLPNLPKSSKTLLQTNKSHYFITKMLALDETEGQYAYFGIEQGLRTCINLDLHYANILYLLINIDGIKLFKSSVNDVWPILVKVQCNPDIYSPFVVAIYSGNSKPKYIHEFMKDFIMELNKLLVHGISIQERHFEIKIKGFICDTPARSYLKCIKGHNAAHGCERCEIQGIKHNRTMIFLETNCAERTDYTFRNFIDPHHHNAASPLLFITPPINMINDIILDSMHLCYLGVMKRLIDAWMSTNLKVKFSQNQRKELSMRMLTIKRQQPIEFDRKMRPITDYLKFKATEYRFFLLFAGPILLKRILEKNKYEHFILLHAACRMLSSENAVNFVPTAKDLLNKFILQSKDLYGPDFMVMNVHNLLHISDDVFNTQCNLSSISAFAFESYLGKIKNMLRSPTNVVAQLARRLCEQKTCINQVPSPLVVTILKQNGNNIEALQCINMLLTNKAPDNTVLLKMGCICTINKMYVENNKIKLEGDVCIIKKSVYTNPINSSVLNMWELLESRFDAVRRKTMTTEISWKLKMSEDEDYLHKYQLVQFIRKGPKSGKKEIDVVPSKWISWDQKRLKLTTKFMPGPYDENTSKLLQDFVNHCFDAPESWPTYTVKIVGEAKQYDEALMKLDELSAQEFVFSLPSDEDPKEKSEAKKEFYKKKALNDSAAFVSKFMTSDKNSNSFNSVSEPNKTLKRLKKTNTKKQNKGLNTGSSRIVQMPQLPIDKKIILQREDTLSMDLKNKSQSIVVMDKDIPVLTLNSQNSHGVECENPINFTTLSEEM
ncbi:uncharacterized protein [Linepithema humile]|uniref:uncharacterized protein n=1 Tax=Linepithema humile TaxID=83485 RepID=UPI00351DB6C9